MSKKKYYKVMLSAIDVDKTFKTVDEMKKSDMLYVINHSKYEKVREVIVYKTFLNHFKEIITGKEINAKIEQHKVDSEFEENEHYINNKNLPLFFKCNLDKESEQVPASIYLSIETMEATDEEIKEYLIEHLGTDESNYKYRVQEYLNELNEEESRAIDRYYEVLNGFGYIKKDKRKISKGNSKAKSLMKKYGNK